MGGAATVPGNISPVAEANVYHDPHAAAIVFGAGWKVTMVGLDVTHQIVMTKSYLDEIGSAGNPATDLIRRILPCYQKTHDEFYGMGGDIHTHDPSAIAYLINRRLFKTRSLPLYVETEGHCIGQTIPDTRGMWGDLSAVNVCLDVDAQLVIDLIKKRLMA